MNRSQKSSTVFVVTTLFVAAAIMAIAIWPRSTEQRVVQSASSQSPTVFSVSTKTVSDVRAQPTSRSVMSSTVNMTLLITRLRACLAETDPDRQAQLEDELEALLVDANAAEVLRALPTDLLATQFAEAALRRWVKTDRKGAANWVTQQTGLTEPEQTSVIYGWGREDKNALEDYLSSLPAGEWKQSAMKFAANDALAGERPKDAIDLLVKMDRSPARDDLFSWSATAWAQADSSAALKWADNLQDTAQKQSALGAVAVGLAWTDPVAAGKVLSEQVQSGEVLGRSALSVVCVWSQTDPESAANWVARFPEGKLQHSVLETLIQRWAAQDLTAAKNWANELPPGTLHDVAQKFYAEAAANLLHEPGEEVSVQ